MRNGDYIKDVRGCSGLFREGKGVIGVTSLRTVIAYYSKYIDRRNAYNYSKPDQYLLPKEFLE